MRPEFLDRYSRLDSPIHRLPATAKLLGTLGVLAVTLATPWAFGPVAVLLAGVAVASRIPTGFLLRRLLQLELFVLGAAVLALVQPGGGKLFALIALRTTLGLLALILLSNTTPFGELLRVLRRAHLPALLLTTLALMYRYLFVLTDEAERMLRARASRTFAPRRARLWRSRAAVVGQLFIRSTERAERIYAAMLARGWK